MNQVENYKDGKRVEEYGLVKDIRKEFKPYGSACTDNTGLIMKEPFGIMVR
jgi:hypothetical protein